MRGASLEPRAGNDRRAGGFGSAAFFCSSSASYELMVSLSARGMQKFRRVWFRASGRPTEDFAGPPGRCRRARPNLTFRGALRDHRVRERGGYCGWPRLRCTGWWNDKSPCCSSLTSSSFFPRSGGGEEAIDRADQTHRASSAREKLSGSKWLANGGDGDGDLGLDGAGTRKRDATAPRQGRHETIEVAARSWKSMQLARIPVAIRQIRVVALHQRVGRRP